VSIVYSALVYLAAGLAVAVWLAGIRKLPRGWPVRIALLIFWPAYLPVCLLPERPEQVSMGIDNLLVQIDRLPVDEPRKREYRQAAARLDTALQQRQMELSRLSKTAERLVELGGTFGENGRPMVAEELSRVQAAKQNVAKEITRAKQGVMRLVLRLEVIDLHSPHESVETHLSSLEEELGNLLEARLQV
jgi:hypothetical protein